MAEKRPALGRGLSALIPDAATREAQVEVDLDLLTPNSFQPRVQFDDARLDELAQSIKGHGVIQPIIVRRRGRHYEIIAGERRWRAAQRAGLLRVPVIVRDVPDEKVLEVALIENLATVLDSGLAAYSLSQDGTLAYVPALSLSLRDLVYR